MDQLTIPCAECDATSERLRARGFAVHGCAPESKSDGLCVVSFTSAATEATASAQPGAARAEPPDQPPGTLTPTQIATAQAIVNLFETGAVRGIYGQVTLIPGDTGRLTYGRAQTTLGSGGLAELLQGYCANPGARFGVRLAAELPRLVARAQDVDTDRRLHNVLRACADDPVMRELQDSFFDDHYWGPAARAAQRRGITAPLGVAVVYDSHVHGSWGPRSRDVDRATGSVTEVGERRWIDAYVTSRRKWLAEHPRSDLRATVYRMDAFRRLIDQGFWGLALPLVVRGQEISLASLTAAPPGSYDGPHPGTRPLAVQQPLARGLDVRLVQLGLSERGIDIQADGVFGSVSAERVRAFQIATGRPATGTVDLALIGELVG